MAPDMNEPSAFSTDMLWNWSQSERTISKTFENSPFSLVHIFSFVSFRTLIITRGTERYEVLCESTEVGNFMQGNELKPTSTR